MTALPQDQREGVVAARPDTAATDAAPTGGASLAHACEPASSADVSGTPASTGAGAGDRPRSRLVGIDAARGLALFGMMAVHLITAYPDGKLSWAWALAAGKSAALFALLAGVGVAFASGGRRRPTRRTWPAHASALLVRALIVGAVGLLLGQLVAADDAAVILPYYALLFVLSVPLLTLSIRTLVALAAVIAIGMPILSHLLRAGTEVRGTVPNLTFGSLTGDPAGFLQDLALTGVYPALSWLAYLCVGLAVGRALLTSRRTVVVISLIGLGLIGLSRTVSWLLLDVLGGRAELEAVAGRTMTPSELTEVLAVGWTGTTPPDTGWWLATLAPHSTTPLDLANTIGIGLTVLGICILLGRVTTLLLRPVAAAGSMTLTLYALHLVMLSSPDLPGGPAGLVQQIVVLVAFALIWSRFHSRGPLEEIVAWSSGRVRRAVEGRRRGSVGAHARS